MKPVRSIAELRKYAHQCERILVLVNGSVESAHLCYLLTQHHRDITLLAVDFGTLDRHKISQIACYFPVTLDIMDGRERLQKLAIEPALRATAFDRYGGPFHAELLKMTLADLAVSYATKNNFAAIFYADYDLAAECSDLGRAIEALGYSGFCGSPAPSGAPGYLYRKSELMGLGLKLEERMYLDHCSSFWGHQYEIPAFPDSEDFRVPSALMNELRQPVGHGQDIFSITFTEGVVTHLNLQKMPFPVICEQIKRFASPALLGFFTGTQYWKAGRDHLQLLHAPAATVIINALTMLQEEVMTKNQLKEKAGVVKTWSANTSQGAWFSKARLSAQRLLDQYAKALSGTVHLTVKHGHVERLGVSINKSTLQERPVRATAQ